MAFLAKLRNRNLIYALGIILIFFLALYFSLSGVDYGTQWDQHVIKGFVNLYIRTGRLLPGWYLYPPVSSYYATTTVVPYAVPFLIKYGTNWAPTVEYLRTEVLNNLNPTFDLNLRRVFALGTMVSVLFTGFALHKRSWKAGLIAAGILGLSWEVSYYSRVIAADGLTMQAVALTLLFCFLAYHEGNSRRAWIWLGLAAASSALATATKYTAGISLLTALAIGFWLCLQAGGPKKEDVAKTLLPLVKMAVFVLLIFTITFLILVPGVLAETGAFFSGLQIQADFYTKGHGFHTVQPGWEHFSRYLAYIGTTAFSNFLPISLVILALIIAGGFALAHRKRGSVLLFGGLVAVPILYLLILSTQTIMFVRNVLVIFPYLAILGGLGYVRITELLETRAKVYLTLFNIALVAIALANIYWLGYTAWTINNRETGFYTADALAAIQAHPDSLVYITPSALQQLGTRNLPANATLEYTDDLDLVLFSYRGDTQSEQEGSWPINYPYSSPQVFGALDINLSWYANWPGSERLVLSVPSLAWKDGAQLRVSKGIELTEQPIQSASGTLDLDSEQFFLEDPASSRVYILNSANPTLILALRPLIGEQVSLAGPTQLVSTSGYLLVSSVNGAEVLDADRLDYEFHTIRFLSNLTSEEGKCIQAEFDPLKFQALAANVISMVDLEDQELMDISSCLN